MNFYGRRTPESVIAEAHKKVAHRENLIVTLERQIPVEAVRENKAALIRRLLRAQLALKAERLVLGATLYKFSRYPKWKWVRFSHPELLTCAQRSLTRSNL